tara:strand:- start:1324 stop:1716 length:393 start_codon:yes stop_codon:yes gene_type:complete
MQTKGYLQNWLDNFRSEDPSFLDDILDESVTFYSPVVFSPIQGKAMTTLYLMAAGQSFNMDRFEYVKTVVQDPYSILEFETYIDDISVNGIDVITWNESGKIIEFKVMVRPLKAIEKVQEKMMKSLEEYN